MRSAFGVTPLGVCCAFSKRQTLPRSEPPLAQHPPASTSGGARPGAFSPSKSDLAEGQAETSGKKPGRGSLRSKSARHRRDPTAQKKTARRSDSGNLKKSNPERRRGKLQAGSASLHFTRRRAQLGQARRCPVFKYRSGRRYGQGRDSAAAACHVLRATRRTVGKLLRRNDFSRVGAMPAGSEQHLRRALRDARRCPYNRCNALRLRAAALRATALRAVCSTVQLATSVRQFARPQHAWRMRLPAAYASSLSTVSSSRSMPNGLRM